MSLQNERPLANQSRVVDRYETILIVRLAIKAKPSFLRSCITTEFVIIRLRLRVAATRAVVGHEAGLSWIEGRYGVHQLHRPVTVRTATRARPAVAPGGLGVGTQQPQKKTRRVVLVPGLLKAAP
jgi:hypothetical protein